jgi:N-acetylglucosaminyldiphosphoundecaprenol N-acetyl-beta-D-mannosaminyltransferase
MVDRGKRSILGINVDCVDYEAVVARVLAAALERSPLSVSAVAVHGVMEGTTDPSQKSRMNALDIVTPDGQAVRWAMNALYSEHLKDRVYGPELMRRLCSEAARRRVPIYLYGSTPKTLSLLEKQLATDYSDLQIAGSQPSAFARGDTSERAAVADSIRRAGAGMVFVGLGCPRQEVFAYEFREAVGVPIIAVGAAFDFLAGTASEPSQRIQRLGLQWLHRFAQEPRRLWKRYLALNPKFVAMVCAQALGVKKFHTAGRQPEPIGWI